MPLLIKQIKPQKLKVDAYRLEFLNAMRKAGKVIIKEDYGAITRTWKHKPKFVALISLTGPGPVLFVATDDEIYGYVDLGTKPHDIPKSGSTLLVFSSGYRAKSIPGRIGSSRGGGFGKKVFTVKRDKQGKPIKHPGTKPRNFEKVIKKKRTPWYKREMEKAMKAGNKKAGHSI